MPETTPKTEAVGITCPAEVRADASARIVTYLDPGTAVDPDVRQICLEVVREFPAIPNIWGYSSAASSDHRNRRCIDYMVIGQPSPAAREALGNAIAAYHIQHAARLGVNGIIWDHRVMGLPHKGGQGSYSGPYGKWRRYYGSNPHTDHVHVEYDGSAYDDITPWHWDGHSYPGRDKFRLGLDGAWITHLGRMLVKAGWTGYQVGPGPNFSPTDMAAVQWFQRKQGWTGADADGYPGPETWRRLTDIWTDNNPPKPPEKPVETAAWIAQFNIQRDDWRKPGDEPWKKSLPKIIGLLKGDSAELSPGPSILILQECDREAAAQIQARLGSQWVWDRVGVNAVFRDRRKYRDKGLIEATLPGNGTRSLVAVRLERDGIEFCVGSTHLDSSSDGYRDDDSPELRREQMAAILAKLPRERCVFGGDLNDASRDGVRAQARAAGFRTLDDCTTVRNSQLGTTDDQRNIDECFITPDMAVTAAEIVYVGRASDHNITHFRLVLNPEEIKP